MQRSTRPSACRLVHTLAWVILAAGCGRSTANRGPADAVADPQPGSEAKDRDLVPPEPFETALDRWTGDPSLPDRPDTESASNPPVFTRPDQGDPVSQQEVSDATTLYLDLLRGTRYFEVVSERAHGWPRSDPDGRYWFSTWWSGVRVLKKDGRVTYLHSADGADNNGMRTAPILSAACFAHSLYRNQAPLIRRLIRGFNSWILAMEREHGPDTGVLMTRAHYPQSIQSLDDGREVFVDYSLNRPGEDNDATIYVHNPDNPYWGDIYVKNKRSKDDIGYLLLAIALLPACTADADADTQADLETLMDLYGAWARRVEDDGWRIATVDRDWQVYWPEEDLAFFIEFGGIECKAMLAIRLFGRGDAGSLDCGNGLSDLDEVFGLKNDFHQIQRSFHEAATALAFLRGDQELGNALLAGLARRLDILFDARESKNPPAEPGDQDLAELVVMAAVVGVPLTSREVRFLHDRIRDAHQTYLADAMRPHYHVFDAETPDGEYAFTPDASGFFWRYLGTLLGLCASPYRNETSREVLDCDAVRAAGLRAPGP